MSRTDEALHSQFDDKKAILKKVSFKNTFKLTSSVARSSDIQRQSSSYLWSLLQRFRGSQIYLLSLFQRLRGFNDLTSCYCFSHGSTVRSVRTLFFVYNVRTVRVRYYAVRWCTLTAFNDEKKYIMYILDVWMESNGSGLHFQFH